MYATMPLKRLINKTLKLVTLNLKKMCENKIRELSLFPSNHSEIATLTSKYGHHYLFRGYGIQNNQYHPFYRTINSDYGWFTPSPHHISPYYYPLTQTFTKHLAASGMYRNFSLNTMSDKTFF